ncbi:MAG: putative toxin-antitoxin system toxin component, PIN family [Chloroflexi bacterium]|nr:putative toxin-antitoxin system toxin component, PIN family [Chloroflexota bacterium]MBU1662148.1 putative toxin-antitoxin system toxin component, PIN family [Chloroflexota bacterium]
MRVVIDTNVWVSALLWRGLPYKFLKFTKHGDVEICVTAPILAELSRVLAYPKFQHRLKEMGVSISYLVGQATALSSLFTAVSSPEETLVPADPDDDIVILAAISARASFIISGDKHLLSLGEYRGIPIVKVHEFLKIVRGGTSKQKSCSSITAADCLYTDISIKLRKRIRLIREIRVPFLASLILEQV